MTEFVNASTLASYPGLELAEDQIPGIVIELTNDLINEVVEEVLGAGVPLDPISPKIRSIALEVAARSIRYAAGASSITEGIDDWKKTVRFESAEKFRAGIYLTDEEEKTIRRKLRGTSTKRIGSIRLHVPGYGRGSASF